MEYSSNPSRTTSATRYETQADSQGSSESPRRIMDFMTHEMESSNQRYSLQRPIRAISNLSTTTSGTSRHHPIPTLRLQPRHDFINSLSNANSSPRSQGSWQQTSPKSLFDRETAYINSDFSVPHNLEIRVGEIPSNLMIPMDF